MAFHAINSILGLEGIVLILLVFEAYSRIVEIDALSLLVVKRIAAIHQVMEELRKLRFKRLV